MRSIVKFKLSWLSKYLVKTWLIDLNVYKFIESAMSVKRLLWIEWCGKEGSQILFLMLKFSAITKMLLILTSVFFRYFKAVCDKSE